MMKEKLPNLAAGKSLTYSSQLAMSSFHLLYSSLAFRCALAFGNLNIHSSSYYSLNLTYSHLHSNIFTYLHLISYILPPPF